MIDYWFEGKYFLKGQVCFICMEEDHLIDFDVHTKYRLIPSATNSENQKSKFLKKVPIKCVNQFNCLEFNILILMIEKKVL